MKRHWFARIVCVWVVSVLGAITAHAQQPPLRPSENEDIPFHLGRMYPKTSPAIAWAALEKGSRWARRRKKTSLVFFAARWLNPVSF
jgi:hypothetical protein